MQLFATDTQSLQASLSRFVRLWKSQRVACVLCEADKEWYCAQSASIKIAEVKTQLTSSSHAIERTRSGGAEAPTSPPEDNSVANPRVPYRYALGPVHYFFEPLRKPSSSAKARGP